jgi:hypothetical protein
MSSLGLNVYFIGANIFLCGLSWQTIRIIARN